MKRIERLWRHAASLRQLARMDNPHIRRRLITLAAQLDKLAKTIEKTVRPSVNRPVNRSSRAAKRNSSPRP